MMKGLPTRLARFAVDSEVDVHRLGAIGRARQRRRDTVVAVAAVVLLAVPTGWAVTGLSDTDITGPRIEENAAECLPTSTESTGHGDLGQLSFVDHPDTQLPVDVPVQTDDGGRNRGEELWVTQTTCRPFGPGTTVVEGHRTLYGATLYDLPRVATGDRIEVVPTDGRRQTYEVVRVATIDADRDPAEVVALDAHPGTDLVITTAAPAFTSDQQQLVVHARLAAEDG